jgi:hypothetical protein
MAAVNRIALFLWNAPGRYREPLRVWAAERPHVDLYTDAAAGEGLHYLRFGEINARAPYDLVLCDIANSAAHAASFPLVLKTAPVLFLDDLHLARYCDAVSHDPRDPWGSGWLREQAAPEDGGIIARLLAAGIEPGKLAEHVYIARALAKRAAAIVVPELAWASKLERDGGSRDVAILPAPGEDGLELFAQSIDRLVPRWIESRRRLLAALEPLAHGNVDLRAVERRRVDHRCPGDVRPLARPAQEALDALFAL